MVFPSSRLKPLQAEFSCHLGQQLLSTMARVLALSAVLFFIVASALGDEQTGSGWKIITGRLKSVAIGASGVWGVTKSNAIFYRVGTYGKEDAAGKGWRHVFGKMAHVSVGKDIVWGVNAYGKIYVRTGISAGRPCGKGWRNIGGGIDLKMVHVSSTSNQVWGVSKHDWIYKRMGITAANPAGTHWRRIFGNFKYVSVGPAGVWGLNRRGSIYYRKGTFGNEAAVGTGWKKVAGRLNQLTVGNGIVWGADRFNRIFVRTGISAANPGGRVWNYIGGRMKSVYVSSTSNQVWAINRGSKIFKRIGIKTAAGR